MNKNEYYVYGPDGTQVIEVAAGPWEAEVRARTRPGFGDAQLRVEFKGAPVAASMRSGTARTWTRAFLEEHKDWKRD